MVASERARHTGLRTGEAPATALANFKKSTTSWSERLNDQWNTAGIKDSDGYPTVTSHCEDLDTAVTSDEHKSAVHLELAPLPRPR